MTLLAVTVILLTVGTVMIYSSSSIIAMDRLKDGQFYLKKHLLFLTIGFLLMMVLQRIPYDQWRRFAYPGVLVSCFLLILVLIPHVGVRAGGATRWLNLGIITFQVTELVKVALVLFLAHFLTRKIAQIKQFSRGIAIPLGVTLFVVGLVMLQPDFGSAAILMAILLLMLYLAGTRLAYLGGLAAAFLPVALYLVIHKSYRMARLMTFLDPWKDPRNSGFQIIQSLLSFGSGGTFGVGLGDGMQKLFYLPEPHTDFILSVIAEESGFIGVAIVILLFGVLIIRGFFIAFKAPDLFGTLLAAGLTMTLALEAFINIAGVMGLIPLKGLALPVLSYGGSAPLMGLAAVGILLNISAQESGRRGGTLT